MRYSNLLKIVNDWLTNLNECWRMIDKTFICHNFCNMLKFIPRTRIIATDTNVHTRIHTNSTTMYDIFNSGPIRKYTQVFVGGCLFIWLLAKTLLFILTNQCRISRKRRCVFWFRLHMPMLTANFDNVTTVVWKKIGSLLGRRPLVL